MADFHTDNNILMALARALIDLGHRGTAPRDVRLVGALDAVHLAHAARTGRISLTADGGFAALHDAWHCWMVEPGLEPPRAGIVWVQTPAVHLASEVARRLHLALAGNWAPTATMWQVNARHGWKRAIGRSSTRATRYPGHFCALPPDPP